jgi:hypothetical protein
VNEHGVHVHRVDREPRGRFPLSQDFEVDSVEAPVVQDLLGFGVARKLGAATVRQH